MRLVTFQPPTPGSPPRLGALLGDDVVDLNTALVCHLRTKLGGDRAYEVAAQDLPPDMVAWFRTGEAGRLAAREAFEFVQHAQRRGLQPIAPRSEPAIHPAEDARLLAPVPRPNSIRDFLSFEGHGSTAKTSDWYEMPVYYRGNHCAVIGPEETIPWPSYSDRLDYELEYGICIGKEGRNIPRDKAAEYIAGFTIFNDVSARDAKPNFYLSPGKVKDFCNVMGPCMVTPDEIDPMNLRMVARINGEVWTDGNTSAMYWTWGELVEYASMEETLYPGDFLGSGTVAGGCGVDHGRWLQPGDLIELEVEGIGILRNRVGPKPELRRSLRLRQKR